MIVITEHLARALVTCLNDCRHHLIEHSSEFQHVHPARLEYDCETLAAALNLASSLPPPPSPSLKRPWLPARLAWLSLCRFLRRILSP